MVSCRTLVLLCIFAAPILGFGPWDEGLTVKFGNPLDFSKKSFIDLPRTKSNAISKGWKQVTGPDYLPKTESLGLWCLPADPAVCIFIYGAVTVGLQIALPKDKFFPYYDATEQGLTSWSYTLNGQSTEYYVIPQYWVSPDTLAKGQDVEEFTEGRPLLNTDVWVRGFNGEMFNIPVNTTDMDTGKTMWKGQACMPLMGKHYYYNMTESLDCSKPILSWFPLTDEKRHELIGVGFVIFGQFNRSKTDVMLESPPTIAVKSIVYKGPQCLYDLSDFPGVTTLHIYYIDNPKFIFCFDFFK